MRLEDFDSSPDDMTSPNGFESINYQITESDSVGPEVDAFLVPITVAAVVILIIGFVAFIVGMSI